MLPPSASPPKDSVFKEVLLLKLDVVSLRAKNWVRTKAQLRFAKYSTPRTLIIKQQMLNSCLTSFFLRKEVIQPHLPIRLPCYDFTPVIGPAFGSSLLTVGSLTSGVTDSHGVTGGVYKTRERIHRDILIRDY